MICPSRCIVPCDGNWDWPTETGLTEEFKAIGFYLSGHPLGLTLHGPMKRKSATAVVGRF